MTAAAFDAVALQYDRELTEHQLGRWLRARVHERLERLFAPGSRVLELGCGTGEDAVWLARRGVRVHATDASPAMLEVTRGKAKAAGVSELVQVSRLDLNDPAQRPADLAGFDGVFSNFGAVNCARSLPELSRLVAGSMRPGGRGVLVPMPRLCLFELFFHLLRGRPGVAVRRWRDGRLAHTGGGTQLRTFYPTLDAWRRALEPELQITACEGLGVVLPTTDLRHLVSRFPRIFEVLEPIDRRLGRVPGAARVADHCVLELRRRGGES